MDREDERREIILAMIDFLEPWLAERWMYLPIPGFGYATPTEMLRAGRSDLIWDLIDQLRSGAYI